MLQILIYGDSLSWGIIPGKRERWAFDERWPIIMEQQLGGKARVCEQSLSGRGTVFPEPFRPWRNGADYLEFEMQCHAPLNLVILALGTNDLQALHNVGPWESTQGLAFLIDKVQNWRGEPAGPPPQLLVISPPLITKPTGLMAEKFRGAEVKSAAQIKSFAALAKEKNCAFWDISSELVPSEIDGIHFDKETQRAFGLRAAEHVRNILEI